MYVPEIAFLTIVIMCSDGTAVTCSQAADANRGAAVSN